MANIKTRSVTESEYKQIITALRSGYVLPSGRKIRPNEPIATALTLEANLGMRISDILELRLDSIVYESGRHHLQVYEQKTAKETLI